MIKVETYDAMNGRNRHWMESRRTEEAWLFPALPPREIGVAVAGREGGGDEMFQQPAMVVEHEADGVTSGASRRGKSSVLPDVVSLRQFKSQRSNAYGRGRGEPQNMREKKTKVM